MWLKVVTMKNLAERVDRFLYKGMKVFVSGKLVIRRYTDKDGNERSITEMIAFDLDWDMKASKGDRNNSDSIREVKDATDAFNPYTDMEMTDA
jgi:single-stranded DNA-binding protein